MREMVGDQTANQAAKHLREKKEKHHQFWNSRIAVLVVLLLLWHSDLSVCISLAGLVPSCGGWHVGGVPWAYRPRPFLEVN
jgi:hypothetical protein